MQFSELVCRRYSVRAYRPDPVEEHKLSYVLDAARTAPTAANRQPFNLVLIHTAGREQELRRVYDREWFVQAPFLVCACAIPSKAWVRRDGMNYAVVDTAIIFDHLTLAAADVGLGTCWVAAFDIAAAREILQLPQEVEPIAFTPLGYPADNPSPKIRQPLTQLVKYEKWTRGS